MSAHGSPTLRTTRAVPRTASRVTRAASLGLGLAVAASLAFSAPLARADQGTRAPANTQVPTKATSGCSLVNQTLSATSTKNTALDQTFSTYGNTSGQWVGADTTNSVVLKDGSTAWIFSDTLYGTVTNNTLSPTDSSFLNNTIIRQGKNGSLTTVTGGTAADPTALVPPAANGDWHWFGDGELRPNGDLQIGVLTFGRFGPGPWDWGWKKNEVATINTKTWTVTSVTPLPSGANIQWASYYIRDGGDTIVYGVEDLGATKYLHVAKVLGGDLAKTSNWRYWNGSTWSKVETDSVRVTDGVANEISVTPFADGYLLVTQDTTELFSNKVVGYTSCSPTGPFVNKTQLFTMPEVGLWGSYGDPNIFAYNAHEHLQLRSGNTITVSYNVNTFDNMHVYDDVTIYRPRFVDVTLTLS